MSSVSPTRPAVAASPVLLQRGRTTLVVIDVQEAFAKAVAGFDALAARVARLVAGARLLDVPIVVTEQYPRGLGATVASLLAELGDTPRLAKTVFSAARAEGFALEPDRDQVLICGIEAHVCVNQTACDLLAAGRQVHVVTDAVSSRTAADLAVGLAKMERAGALPTSTETALFELLTDAGDGAFRAVQALVKDPVPGTTTGGGPDQ